MSDKTFVSKLQAALTKEGAAYHRQNYEAQRLAIRIEELLRRHYRLGVDAVPDNLETSLSNAMLQVKNGTFRHIPSIVKVDAASFFLCLRSLLDSDYCKTAYLFFKDLTFGVGEYEPILAEEIIQTAMNGVNRDDISIKFENCASSLNLIFQNSSLKNIVLQNVKAPEFSFTGSSLNSFTSIACEIDGLDLDYSTIRQHVFITDHRAVQETSGTPEIKLENADVLGDLNIKGQNSLCIAAKSLKLTGSFELSGKSSEAQLPIKLDIGGAELKKRCRFRYLEIVCKKGATFDMSASRIDFLDLSSLRTDFLKPLQKNGTKQIGLDHFEVRRIAPPVGEADDTKSTNDFLIDFLKLGSEPNNLDEYSQPGTGNYVTLASALRRSGYNTIADQVALLQAEKKLKDSEIGRSIKPSTHIMLMSLSVLAFFFLILSRSIADVFEKKLSDYSIFNFFYIYGPPAFLSLAVAGMFFFKSWLVEYLVYWIETSILWLFKNGQKPIYATFTLVLITLAGTVVFWMAEYKGLVTPTLPEIYHLELKLHQIDKIRGYPPFNHSHFDKSFDREMLEIKKFHTEKSVALEQKALNAACKGKKNRKTCMDDLSLVGLFKACRLNWANPLAIPDEEWTKYALKGMSSNTKKIYNSIWWDRKMICEKFLPAEHSKFVAFIYSLDIAIPLLDLRQEEEWGPSIVKANSGEISGWGLVLVVTESVLIVFGWLTAIILAAAITGLADPSRKRP